VPVALIFCFHTLLLFTLVPSLRALAAPQHESVTKVAIDVVKRIVSHPLVIATALGVLSAALDFQPPLALERLMQFLQNAAAPCALFALGVTVALRPLKKMPWRCRRSHSSNSPSTWCWCSC
jgi:predicted permease